MKMKSTYILKHKRRRLKKTDYNKRLGMLKSRMKRIVIRKSNKYLKISLIETNKEAQDNTISSISSKKLREFSWIATKNTPTAYLTGYLFGLQLKQKFDEKCIIDIGKHTPLKKSAIFGAMKGLVDAGIQAKVSEEAFPDEARISGKYIEDYAKKLKDDELNKKFSYYLKNNFDVRNLSRKFEETKKAIEEKFRVNE